MTNLTFGESLISRIRVYSRKVLERITKERVLADPLEPKLLILCRKLIQDSNSEMYICPESKNRYINNYTSNIYVIIGVYSIKICSESYQEIPICPHSHRSICQVLDNRLISTSRRVLEHFRASIEADFSQTFLNYIK